MSDPTEIVEARSPAWFQLTNMFLVGGTHEPPRVNLEVTVQEPGMDLRIVTRSSGGDPSEPYSTNALLLALAAVVGADVVLTGLEIRTATTRADTEVIVGVVLVSNGISKRGEARGEGIFRVIAGAYLEAASQLAEREHAQTVDPKHGEAEIPTG